MASIKYIYQLVQSEINELESTNWENIDSLIIWINKKLQEAFNEGQEHPLKRRDYNG